MNECKLEGCEAPVYVSKTGYCKKHYERNRATGDPRGINYKKPKTCTTGDCGKQVWAKGMCRKCYSSHYYHNRPVRPVDPNHWAAKEVPSYASAHSRVRAARGPAGDYLCACGCQQQAKEWALKAGTANVFYGSQHKRETLSAYSLNPYDYLPMTSAHHKAYDSEHRNRNYKHDKMIDRDAA